MARTPKAATETEPQGEVKVEPTETTWHAVSESEVAKAARAFSTAVGAVVRGEVALEGGYAKLAETVMGLRACFVKVVISEAGKSTQVRDWDGRSRPYQAEVGKVYDVVLKGQEHLRTVITDRVRYHAQSLREAMVKDGRIPRAEAQALGLTPSKKSRQAQKAAEAREEAKAMREEAKAIIASTEGKAEASMAEVLKFAARVTEAITQSPDAATLGVTPPQMATWALGANRAIRDAVEAFKAKGYGDPFPPKATEPTEAKATRTTRKSA